MLTLHLAPVFRARGIEKPYAFLKSNGFSHAMATKLSRGKHRNISLNHLEHLCSVLWCRLDELFLWTPDANMLSGEDHPLFPLSQPREVRLNIRAALSRLPLSELDRLAALLDQDSQKNAGPSEPGA